MREILFVFGLFAALTLRAQDASPSPTPEPPSKEEVFDQKIIDTALGQVGVIKQVGYESPKVKNYVESTDQEADEYYGDGWCNAFVSWVLKQNGYEYMSLNSVDQVGHFFHQVSIPKIGDIITMAGHITFYAGKANLPGLDIAILILGGNQGHAVNELPIAESNVVAYWEPIKAPKGWVPSRFLSRDSMMGFNRIDDKGYMAAVIEKALQIPVY